LFKKTFLDSNLFQSSTVPRISPGAGKEDKLEENLKDPQAEELLGDWHFLPYNNKNMKNKNIRRFENLKFLNYCTTWIINLGPKYPRHKGAHSPLAIGAWAYNSVFSQQYDP
jgi:hypothetical protein